MKWRILGLGVAGALVLAGCGTHSTKPATPSPSNKAPAVSVPPNQPPGSNAPKSLGQVQARVNQLRQAALAKHVAPPLLAKAKAAGVNVSAATKYSGNWSGYVDVSHAYGDMNATWTVPKATCLTESYMVQWVGIDGWANGSVEQDGTGAYCSGKGAVPYYFIWWEMYPQNSVQFTTLSVKPGDKIVAGVKYMNNNRYWLQVVNKTTGKVASTTQLKSGAYSNRNSAEWITEAPAGPSGQYALTKFDDSIFSATQAQSSVWKNTGNWSNYAVIMWPNTYALAYPYALYSNGSAFKDHWAHSY